MVPDDELVKLDCTFRQKHSALEGLAKDLQSYPGEMLQAMKLQRELIEGIRDVLQNGHKDGRYPSSRLQCAQKTVVALLELERSMQEEIEHWIGSNLVLKDLETMCGNFGKVARKFKDCEMARIKGKSSEKNRLQYEKISQELKKEMPDFLHHSTRAVEPAIAKLHAFQQKIYEEWSKAFQSLSFIQDSDNDEIMEDLTKAKLILDQFLPSFGDREEPTCHSPTDVPIAEIVTPSSPVAGPAQKFMYQIHKPAKKETVSEDTKANNVDSVKTSFEAMHLEHAPVEPEMPAGRSRVAELAAQLEASKIIFRPMEISRKPRIISNDEHGEEETSYERHLGFRKNGVGVPSRKSKQAVPPKPPKREYVLAMHDFAGGNPGELAFKRGSKIELLYKTENPVDWWAGRLAGKTGIFPSTYTRSFF